MEAQMARHTIQRLQERADAVWDDAEFRTLRERLADLDSLVDELPIALGRVRERGYAWRKGLEGRVREACARWPEVRRGAEAEMERHAERLAPEVGRAEAAVEDLIPLEDHPLDEVLSTILRAEDALRHLHEAAAEATGHVARLLEPFDDEVQRLAKEVRDCLRVLDVRDSAYFALEPDEHLVEAVEAAWLRPEGHEHAGVLYLTDRRLIYERREQVPGRRVFLFRRPPVRVQEVAWELPVADLDLGEDEGIDRAVILRKDLLVLRFRAPHSPREAVLRLNATPEAWRERIAQVHSGAIRGDRAR